MTEPKAGFKFVLGVTAVLVALAAIDVGVFLLDAAAGQSPKDATPAEEDDCGCLPENNPHGTDATAIEYARMIEPQLGVPPVVDCGAGVEIPIYVDGEPTRGNPGLHCCDNPSLQCGRLHVGFEPPALRRPGR